MKIHEQVITLEQAKKLKEIGIVEDSLFYYYQSILNGETTYPVIPLYQFHYGTFEEDESLLSAINGDSNNEVYPAFTVSELMDMLPHELGDRMLTIMPPNEGNEYLWTVLYLPLGTSIIDYVEDDYFDAKTLPEALGAMLIQLSDKNSL